MGDFSSGKTVYIIGDSRCRNSSENYELQVSAMLRSSSCWYFSQKRR